MSGSGPLRPEAESEQERDVSGERPRWVIHRGAVWIPSEGGFQYGRKICLGERGTELGQNVGEVGVVDGARMFLVKLGNDCDELRSELDPGARFWRHSE